MSPLAWFRALLASRTERMPAAKPLTGGSVKVSPDLLWYSALRRVAILPNADDGRWDSTVADTLIAATAPHGTVAVVEGD